MELQVNLVNNEYVNCSTRDKVSLNIRSSNARNTAMKCVTQRYIQPLQPLSLRCSCRTVNQDQMVALG